MKYLCCNSTIFYQQDKKRVFLYPALFASILCSYAEISARNAAALSSLCTYPIRNIKLFSEHYFSPCSVQLCLLIFFSKNTSFAVGQHL